ncbi:hypothetical protein NA57DRAFT_54884 [Rhizodiscina lignyota]|uniref:SH3 domain-containing protein n=1 Tax=Rhizodiscina lignyota TaxID=1504668 RepID=A0A9P4M7K8_9PEZI|nr:hypothetical protein NA57DRAFT_54884 [Rhizodiscina lignyota]
MQRMQRKFGAFLPRTADNAVVGTLIAEFKEADRALESLIDASQAWRDAWTDILKHQANLTYELEGIYSPIIATFKDDEGNERHEPAHRPIQTPRLPMQRVAHLRTAYAELKKDLLEEVREMDEKIIKPAQDARAAIQPMKKTIKKREDRKLDYERYQSRVDAVEKKTRRSDRENTALAKHQIDLDRSTADYESADESLKQCLPPLVNGLLSLFPHLLAAQIQIQNALLANCYTTLHNYCQDHSLPSPAPELEEIVATWREDFERPRMEAEQKLRILAEGKAIHQAMDAGSDRKKSYTGLNIRNGFAARRGSSQTSVPQSKSNVQSPGSYRNGAPPPPQMTPMEKPRINSYASTNSLKATRSNDGLIRMSSGGASLYSQGSSTGEQEDYFNVPRATGTINPYSSTPIVTPGGSVVGKKKPPPPPPKKFQSQTWQYVTALYDFDGQGEGDLSFREGDKIKVVKKTDSEMDWWEGELKGRRGAFPANYCKLE